ncbi:MAG: T9SS type A sorting domain-containing protein [Bacteroidales bacterium]
MKNLQSRQKQIPIKSFFIFLAFLTAGSKLVIGQTYTEILGRPTDNSITVSVLFDQQVELYLEYGTIPGIYTSSTEIITNAINTPDEIELNNLNPDTKYYYCTLYRPVGSGPFLSSSEHSFHTQRAPGSTFSFTIEADEHLYDKKGIRSLYNICLANQAKDNPDFMFTLGDVFGDDHHPFDITLHELDLLHKDYRQYFGNICHSVPLYICLGNHEGEKDFYLHHTPPNNMAVYATLWRKFYFPNPYPNNFYSGNTDVEPYEIGNPENYYSWTWGNALFVVLDVYRDDCDTSAKPTNWEWSLGLPQYTWLKNTLENSNAQYKFVFAHHTRGEGRGGILTAKYFEWGGYEADGVTWGFASKRPGWDKPIHQLFVDNGVNIFFQGHDHLFAHEVLDGVTYQEVPMPSDSTYEIGMLANAGAYTSDTLGGSGHLKVTVSPSCVKVDFIRAYLPADTLSGIHHNREVAFSYSIGNCSSEGTYDIIENSTVKVFPNPAKDLLSVELPKDIGHPVFSIVNTFGQTILQTKSRDFGLGGIQNGMYFLNIKTEFYEVNKKVVICH